MQADILSAEEIKKYLTKERKNNIAVFDTVDSTNTILKNWCAEGKARPGDCVTADCQTKGRGRRGKRFESDKGVGIYLSFLLGTGDATPDEISEITAWGAVAVRRAIEKVCHAGSKIKWVNDIVCGRMKICGILTEMTSAGPVMGIGINVNQSEDGFPPELRNIASSLRIICKREFCRAQIIAAVIEELDLINAGFPVIAANTAYAILFLLMNTMLFLNMITAAAMCPAAPISSAIILTASNAVSKCTEVFMISAARITAKPTKHIGITTVRTAESFGFLPDCAASINEETAAASVRTAPVIIEIVAPTVILVG